MAGVLDPSHAEKLSSLGFINLGDVFWNAGTTLLYEEAIIRGEGILAHNGPLVVETAPYSGRSPKDRYIVMDEVSRDKVAWGDINVPIEEEKYEKLFSRVQAYVQGRDLFVQDCEVGADDTHKKHIRVVTEYAWHNLFARNMFRGKNEPGYTHEPEFTIVNMSNFKSIPELDGVRSEAFVIISFKHKMVLIGSALYGGEIKKAMFSVMNYLLPQEDVLPMHCSANVGKDGKSALFFGLSGTGKTTLSADPNRGLIGDDEHGWSENGIFNMEGGCYAKVIRLSAEAEPEIYATTRRFGTILENVVLDPETRRIDLDSAEITENTRASYPLTHIPNIVPESNGPHPRAVMFLTADAFGVLPPISKLTKEQAMYHFISGYTAKLAGTECGITEPVATFSALFGAPFMPLPASTYAKMLGERIEEHDSHVWLVNTGWTGGAFGEGERMPIKHTRAMVNAALNGDLDNVEFEQEPFFGLQVPKSVPNVPNEVLNPRNTWKDKVAYDKKAEELASLFHKNFTQFAETTTDDIKNACPLVGRA